MKKYLIEILLLALIGAGIFFGYKYWFSGKNSVLSFFEAPEVEQAKVKTGYTVQIKFSDPTALHNITLKGRVLTGKGEEDLGEFVVKDIRIWRPDGYRIIKDEVPVKNLPNHITISQKNDASEQVLFDGNVALGKTIISSTDKSIASDLIITINKQ